MIQSSRQTVTIKIQDKSITQADYHIDVSCESYFILL